MFYVIANYIIISWVISVFNGWKERIPLNKKKNKDQNEFLFSM